MSDEEDYMSDKFLQDCQKYVAPSLIFRSEDKRELEIMKRKAEIEARLKEKKPIKVIEEEKREEGLSSAISSDNKGFEMLMKMGYNPGKGLGKKETGISEPIGVDLKNNRHGLGKEKIKIPKKTNPIANLEKMDADEFRKRVANKKAEQVATMDLHKSQRICEQLDINFKIEKPVENWFWFPKEKEGKEFEESETSDDDDDDENENEEKLLNSEKLEILTKYLRGKYFYCIWCGVAYDNEEDLRETCPGNTRSDH
ncbi:G patch domain-containing protein 11 [Leptopilina boulardi]|uniref:G patch domain-containing protein 11 n=1 Tax=Leptopilina boulardi TaxID=63433 RepID=UPI0021F584C4|nr:G patch domain-containing protein 11 [Leptopilina boulardi]